ncbi:MAG: hypothetical protein AB7O48_14600 [Cyclobacteriaceae bacterium]
MNPTIQLLVSLLLTDFPSGSALCYHAGKIYLIGDDATQIVVLNPDYGKVDSITLFNSSERRIPKSQKTDLEAATLVELKGQKHILIVGSASTEKRKRVTLIPMNSLGQLQEPLRWYDVREFIDRIVMSGIEDVNLEGVTIIGGLAILANRGNQSKPTNHMIVTENNFWDSQTETPIDICPLILPDSHTEFAGVSEVYYSGANDVLFLSFSNEDSSNSYDDGTIGGSFIGWINNASQRIDSREWRLDGLIPLADVAQEFAKQKIEGLCVELVEGNKYILHLISDNDLGESKLFKIKMEFQSK